MSPLICDCFSDFLLCLVTLSVLRSTGKGSCGMSFSLTLSDVFHMSRLGFWVLGKITTGVKCPFDHIILRVDDITVILTSTPWLMSCCQVSQYKVTVFFFPVLFFGNKSLSLDHFTGVSSGRAETSFTSWREGRYLHILFGILLEERLDFSPPFQFNYLFIPTCTHVYLFYILTCNPILWYLFCWSTCSNFSQWEFLQVWAAASFWHVPLCLFGEHGLFCTARFSRLIFYFTCPSSSIRYFSKEPWFLLFKNGV